MAWIRTRGSASSDVGATRSTCGQDALSRVRARGWGLCRAIGRRRSYLISGSWSTFLFISINQSSFVFFFAQELITALTQIKPEENGLI